MRMAILLAEFISAPKVYTFSFIVGTIPKSVKRIHSATKAFRVWDYSGPEVTAQSWKHENYQPSQRLHVPI